MTISLKRISLVVLAAALFARNAHAVDKINLGDAASEKAHDVAAEHAEIVGSTYPDNYVISVLASGFQQGHEPTLALDGKDDTTWQVAGKLQEPMVRGHWIEVDLDRSTVVGGVSIRWLGEKPYDFQIQEQPFEDFRRTVHTGKSKGGSPELEAYEFSKPAETRAIRVEFAVDPGGAPQGIAELRIEPLKYPEGYPQAAYAEAYAEAPVEIVRRPQYVEFERMLKWPAFNPKRALADGGTARRLLPRDDAFEGGRVDFDVAVDPHEANWITLRSWESDPRPISERGNGIVIQTLGGAAPRDGRTLLPKLVTEEQNWLFEWYGRKPVAGRWTHASYALPRDVTIGKSRIRLRLQGVGNARRDLPMRGPSSPVYTITSDVRPHVE